MEGGVGLAKGCERKEAKRRRKKTDICKCIDTEGPALRDGARLSGLGGAGRVIINLPLLSTTNPSPI